MKRGFHNWQRISDGCRQINQFLRLGWIFKILFHADRQYIFAPKQKGTVGCFRYVILELRNCFDLPENVSALNIN